LFLDRAALVRPDFEPVGDELAAVVRVCRRLEGIPLAIELAAARLNVLSVVQLEHRLDRRFALLRGTTYRSARHRTLRATVEWSYDLLGEAEQRGWSTLAVFVGGFDLEAATFLLEVDELDAVDLLTALVDRSILQASVGARDVRYRMLETIRDFGREKLVESGALVAVRTRQRAWALEIAAQAEPEHMTNRGPEWHNRLDLEYPNLRHAIESGVEDDAPDESLRLCADLGIFFWLRGHLTHGRDWCERSLAASDHAEVGLRGRGLLSLGTVMYGQLDFPASRPTLEAGVRLASSVGDEPTVGWASIFLAVIHASRGDADASRAALEEAMRVAEYNVTPSVRAAAYYMAGMVNATLGDEAEATKYLDLAVDLAREAGSPYTLARILPLIARRLHASGDHDAAVVAFEEAIDLARSTGDRVGLARSLQYMAERHIASGEYERATARLEEAQPIVSREIDDAALACRVELTSSTLCRHQGHALGAQAHMDRALTWASSLDVWQSSMDPHLVQAELAVDRGDRHLALSALARSKASARRAKHVERLARVLLLEARVLADLGRLNEANATLAEAEEQLATSDDPTVRALLGHARGCVARADHRSADAVTSLRDAVDAATAAGAALLAVECKEDLALALHAADPADHLPVELVASATTERFRMGTPRPAPRAEELAKVGIPRETADTAPRNP
jgi:non-specific serine/threonine protein kinase